MVCGEVDGAFLSPRATEDPCGWKKDQLGESQLSVRGEQSLPYTPPVLCCVAVILGMFLDVPHPCKTDAQTPSSIWGKP